MRKLRRRRRVDDPVQLAVDRRDELNGIDVGLVRAFEDPRQRVGLA
jgi:hypothetical protein